MRISFMRWRPAATAGSLGSGENGSEINGVPSRVRFRMFIRKQIVDRTSSLLSWQGSDRIAAAWFPAENRLRSGAWCGRRSPAVYAYSVGYWASGPQQDPIRRRIRMLKIRNRLPGIGLLPAGCDGGCGFFCGGAAICYAVFSPSIGRIVEGERTVLEGAAGNRQ